MNFFQKYVFLKLVLFVFSFFVIQIFFNFFKILIQKPNIIINDNLLQVNRFLPKFKKQLLFNTNLKTYSSTNLAIDFYHKLKLNNFSSIQKHLYVTYCKNVQFTSPLQLLHNNFYWQMLHAELKQNKSQTIYLLNAYYDNRNAKTPIVVIIAESKRHLFVSQNKFW